MTWSETAGDEVRVYWRGQLIYKRWIRRGHGVVLESYGSSRDRRGNKP